jgi:hypothetical protein
MHCNDRGSGEREPDEDEAKERFGIISSGIMEPSWPQLGHSTCVISPEGLWFSDALVDE